MSPVLNKCTATSKGEQRVARLLESFEDENFQLCFSVGFIPGVREIDLLLIDLGLGAFIIEIKAISLSMIQSVSPNLWGIRDRDTSESPLQQAYSQYEGLRTFWRVRMNSKLPPIGITACLPEITRYDWCEAFRDNVYATTISNGLIFQDDLKDPESLYSRLHYVMINPPIRKGFTPANPTTKFLDEFKLLLKPAEPQMATTVDRQRLMAIEKGLTTDLNKEFPAGGSAFAVFSGFPGTGKTFRLLSIGVSHAYLNQRVLFACFNKTLASDVRRLLSFNDKLTHTRHQIDVVDIYQLAIRVFEMNGLPYEKTSTPDEWGKFVVEYLREKGERASAGSYDTILVDEAHDMMDWQLDLLSLHAKAGATICIAVGKGQELYRDDSSAVTWLRDRAADQAVSEKALRRNFRNTPMQYFAALAFHQSWPNHLEEVEKAYSSVIRKKSKNEEFDFERQGEPLKFLPVPAIPGEFEDNGNEQERLISDEYAEILNKEIDEIEANEFSHPVGLLVLVPDENCSHTIWVREGLRKAISGRNGISFIDYTDDENRRSMALTSEIRLCTFHSSRGLEGERVVIFGLEQIDAFAAKTKVKAENLGFIALSRGIFRTTVVARSYYTNNVHKLLKAILHVDDKDSVRR